jgi:antirestriction protein ArdC
MRPQNANDKPPPRDYRQEITDQVIKLLESGTSPWQKPWDAGELGGIPYNPTTMKPYRGGNVLGLMIASMSRGYTDPRFCTYKQAIDNGWQVRKGEKATTIEFWDVKPSDNEGGAADEEKRGHTIHRVYHVFNAQQIEGIPPLVTQPRKPFQIIEAGEKVMKDSGADIRQGGAKAYYSPSGDYIQMPPKDCLVDELHYYATSLHELTHWTGAKHRLDSDISHPFGFPGYAQEEMRADLASLFMAAELGIPYDPKDQASYIQSWIKVLKNDKNEVFRAAADASKACDYVLGKNRVVESPEVEGHHAALVSASRESAARSL